MSGNQRKGIHGEDMAVDFLSLSGYEIVQRRYRCRYGEIDIIARDGCTMVFVEVKSRYGDVYGAPAEAVTQKKRRSFIKSVQFYLQQHGLDDAPVRLDVVEVYLDSRRINHIAQAFEG